MRNELETKLTDAVIACLSHDADPRFRRIMQSLIRHVHDYLWQSNSEGSYDVQLADTGGKQLRAKLRTDAEGRKLGLKAPFYSASYDFVLRPSGEAKQHAARAASDAV